MTTNSPKQQSIKPDQAVIDWLLDADPAIRWQVLQDLIGISAQEVAAERAKVATQGWETENGSSQEKVPTGNPCRTADLHKILISSSNPEDIQPLYPFRSQIAYHYSTKSAICDRGHYIIRSS